MRTTIAALICFMLAAPGCRATDKVQEGTLVPFELSVDPRVFDRDPATSRNVVTVAASFGTQVPMTCAPLIERGIMLRLYDPKLLGGEPNINTKYLAQQLTALPAPTDPVSPTSKMEIVLGPLKVPHDAPDSVFLGVWNWCNSQWDEGQGKALMGEKEFGAFIGGALYDFVCPGGTDQLCGYRRQ